ncbi:MAG: hypothetical protein FJX54_12525 [Alphaproteobacteria bacterium]|nr:hypothetical protein [Alphaproteobacteria bacterium]
MKFFLDNNWSPHLAAALAALNVPEGHEVVHLRSRFAPATPDRVWINRLAAEGGWIVLTKDRLRKGQLEQAALRSSGLLVYIFAKQWSHASDWDQAAGLVRWWPQIVTVSGRVGAGAFEVPYKISGKGQFRQVTL